MKATNTNTNTNNNKSRLRARHVILAAAVALLFCATATGAAALAARWFDQNDKTDNTVTVDQPVTVTVSGTASGGIIMPGVGTSKVTAEFNISITGEGRLAYKLVVKDVKFEFGAGILGNERSDGYYADQSEFEALFGAGYTDLNGTPDADAFAAFIKEFKVSFNGGAAANLTEGMIILDKAATAADQKVSVSATDDLLLIARGGTLSFTLALEVA